MSYYKIANLVMHVSWENEAERDRAYSYHDCTILPRCLEAYRIEEAAAADFNVFVQERKEAVFPKDYKKVYIQLGYEEDKEHKILFLDIQDEETPAYSIVMSEDYRHTAYIPHKEEYRNYDLQPIQYAFDNVILKANGFVLHGAAIEYQGKGIIFSGLSGAGKSTQAHLWKKYRDALVINGDCPAIRLEENGPYVYGTPWCGTSGESIDRRVPLCAIVLIHQADCNRVRTLEKEEAAVALLSYVFHSNFDSGILESVIENVEAVVSHIQVLEFYCTKEEEAVTELEKYIR